MAWSKKRALEYVDRGDLTNAIASLTSDLSKHDDTLSYASDVLIAAVGIKCVIDGDAARLRRFIEGFI